MKFFRQLLSSVLIISLLIPAIPVGAQTVTEPTEYQSSLRQIKEQAKKDVALLKNSYGQKTKDILPAVLAFTPLLVTPLDRVITNAISDLSYYINGAARNGSARNIISSEQIKLLSSLTEALDKRQYSQALAIFDQIEPSTWKQFMSRSHWLTDFDVNLHNLLLREVNPTSAHAAAQGTLPMTEFYVLERPHLYTRVLEADNTYLAFRLTNLTTTYNDIRDILQFIEKNKRVLKETEILQRIESEYAFKPWWNGTQDMSRIIQTIIHKKDLLYKNPEKLMKYIEKLETIPMPLQTRRALQTNLLARTKNLKCRILDTFQFKTFDLQSKLTKPKTNSLLLRGQNIYGIALFLLVAGAAAFTSTSLSAQNEDDVLLQRLHNNLDLFLDASDQDLEYIANHPLSAQYCIEAAQSLHTAAMDPSIVPVTQQLMQEMQAEQMSDEISQHIAKTIRLSNNAH